MNIFFDLNILILKLLVYVSLKTAIPVLSKKEFKKHRSDTRGVIYPDLRVKTRWKLECQ